MDASKHTPGLTCATCVHIGRIYHDNGFEPDHSCGKEAERRAAAMKPSGVFAEDFMRNWRTFFDARPDQRACAHHEERPAIGAADLQVLAAFKKADHGRPRATFKFLTPDCGACERMDQRYVQRDRFANPDHTRKAWKLTRLGEAELARAAIAAATGEPT